MSQSSREPKVIGKATVAQILGDFGAAVRPPKRDNPSPEQERRDGRRFVTLRTLHLFASPSAVGNDGY